MKKLFLLVAALLTISLMSQKINPVKAQIVTTVSISAADDTLVNADTAIVAIPVRNSTVSATAALNKVSGTVGGKVYLLATVDGITYDKLDSLTLANQSINNKTFNLHGSNQKLMYASYEFQFITTGTEVAIPKVYATRREY